MKKVTQEQQVIEVLRNRRGYEDSVKAYRDINNAINTAKKEAKAEEKIETARKMKSDGMSAELISKYTGLTIDEIETL